MKSVRKGLAILLAALLVMPGAPVSVERMLVAEAAEAGVGAGQAADVSAAEPESAGAADDGSLTGEEPAGGEADAGLNSGAAGAISPEVPDDAVREAPVDGTEENAEPEDGNEVQGDGENPQLGGKQPEEEETEPRQTPEDGLPIAYAENIVASGVDGNLTWTLDADGLLTISGTGDYSSSPSGNPTWWWDYNDSIISAKVEVTGMTSARGMFDSCFHLTSVDLSGFDTSNVTDVTYMFYRCSSLTSLDLSSFDVSNVIDMQNMFLDCGNLTSLDLSSFHTGNVTNMCGMFTGCRSLMNLNLSSFDTSNVTNMQGMFDGCTSLTNLDLSGFDTSNVTNMESMFAGCTSLTDLNLSGFDTSNVTDMEHMFYGCSGLVNLDLSGFDTSNVPNMQNMFYNCTSLTDLDLTSFDTSNVTNMAAMFYNCTSLKNLDMSSFDTGNVTNMQLMFEYCESLTSLNLNGFDTGNVVYMKDMFALCSSLTSLDLSSFDTSNAISMWGMFGYCSSLASLDLSGFDTSNVRDMRSMFSGCSSLTSLNLSGFDINNADIKGMFSGCSSLASLDLSSFDTSNMASMSFMFDGCSSLMSLDLSSFDTSNVTDMSSMFYGCSSLVSLDLSSFDTSNVARMGFMFYGCSSLTSPDLNSFDTSNVTDMSDMFAGCSSLENLDLSSFDISNVTTGNMFFGCDSLRTLHTPKTIRQAVSLPMVFSDSAGNLTQELTESYANTVLTRKGTRFGFVDGTNEMVCWIYDADTKTTVVTGSGVRMVNADYQQSSLPLDTKYVIFENCEIEGSFGSLFADLGNLKSIDFSGLKVTNPRDYNAMFFGCSSLTELDLNCLSTDNEVSMNRTFFGCTRLTELDLSNFIVNDAFGVFDGCSGLIKLNLSGFDTGNVTSMESMFSGCSNLQNLDISSFDTNNVTQMTVMFSGCSSLTSLDLGSFDMKNVSDAEDMFNGCNQLAEIQAPRNLPQAVVLPTAFDEAWRLPDGTQITQLPQNLSESILIKRYDIGTTEPGGSTDTTESDGFWFRVTGALGHSRYTDIYIAENSPQDIQDTLFDPLYKNTYQTLFINDNNADLASLIPIFENSANTSIFAPGGGLQMSGESVQDFSKGSVIYSAIQYMINGQPSAIPSFPASTSPKADLEVLASQDYTVVFAKKESGPRLFVNGPAEREIFLTDYFQNRHDILIANVGDAQLAGIRAELLDAVNVKLDDSRPVESTLAAFDKVPGQGQEASGVMANFGKVRLVPDGKGEISGTLKITADGQKPVYITLTGYSDNPRITTTTTELNMDDVIRVKYVPYSYTVETNNKYEGNRVTFSVEQGQLAKGLQMYPATGEIYGVPLEAGEFDITVKATFSRPEFLPSYAQLTLIVKENTDENVNVATDPGYDLVRRVEDIVLGTSDRGSQTMVSLGEYAEFQAVYLDGEKLAEGQDYDSEAGSTRVTLRSQTLTGKGVGSHTLGIEFRTQGTGALKRAAQNYTVAQTGNDTGNGGSGNSGESGGNHSGGDTGSDAGLYDVDAEVSETIIYTVRPGDSLWSISFRFYGTGALWRRIYKDNATVIQDSNRIYIGQKLVIRLTDSDSAGIGAGGAKGRIYTVMLGDNLWTIAKKVYGNGMLWEKIYQANREMIFDPRRIYAGQRIVIPQEE